LDPLEITKGTLQALAGQIPVVGPVLTGALAARAKEVQQARLREFLEDLRSEFSRLLPADFDRQYLESQDFAHLLLLAAEHAQRARRQEKRRLYALAIVNAGTHEWAGQSDLAEELLNALADLSWTEVRGSCTRPGRVLLPSSWRLRTVPPLASCRTRASQAATWPLRPPTWA